MDTTKLDPDYIRDLPTWMLEYTKVLLKKKKDGK